MKASGKGDESVAFSVASDMDDEATGPRMPPPATTAEADHRVVTRARPFRRGGAVG
ncbi:hypothetical protein ACGFWE_09985 [Streptomyces sp. NPDC048523]|uniref:hypothetical protein n=1 Tax=unclassified Streptomyces TaxID=2593676 RepID=UPI00332FCB2D